jgi:nitroreductase
MKPTHPVDHPIHELIHRRWSPRAFLPRPVEEERLLAMFEAARWAASSGNEQPWRFIYAHQADGDRFQRLCDCLNPGNAWARSVPVLIMTLVRTHLVRNNQPNRWAFHDLGLAMGNLTIQASALDLWVHNMAGFSVDRARERFAIPPELDPVTMVAVGYLGDPEQLPPDRRQQEWQPQTRKPLDELILKL